MPSSTTPTSYNGWPAITRANDPRLTVITPVRGRSFRVCAGDVAVVFDWLIRRYHQEVDPIDGGQLDDWSYAYRAVRAGASLSNHASGTAVDLNALKHPFNTSAAKSMTRAQIAACRRLIADSIVDGKPVLRWLEGHDPMHWEINRWSAGGDRTRVAKLAARIRATTTRPTPTQPPQEYIEMQLTDKITTSWGTVTVAEALAAAAEIQYAQTERGAVRLDHLVADLDARLPAEIPVSWGTVPLPQALAAPAELLMAPGLDADGQPLPGGVGAVQTDLAIARILQQIQLLNERLAIILEELATRDEVQR